MVKRLIPERATEELDKRLRKLKQYQVTGRLPLFWLQISSVNKMFYIVPIVVLILAGVTISITMYHKVNPITNKIEQRVGFPLLVPTPLPTGLAYVPKPASISQGVVSFSLQSRYGKITITEQAAPSDPPNLNEMGFQSQQVPAGTAYTGTSNGRPLTIISSNTTFIDIVANDGVPSDLVYQVSHSLTLLNN
jgi:hypothetical protein